MTEMTINKLPSKTWYWLHVNETKLPWDKEHTTELPEETVTAGSTEEVRFSITGEGRYSSKKIHIIAPAGKQVTVFMDYQTEEKLAVRTSLSVEEHARVRLVQLQHTAENSLVYNQIEGECAKNARIELVQIYLGKGDIYSDTTINLNGDASSFRSDIGYIGQHPEGSMGLLLIFPQYRRHGYAEELESFQINAILAEGRTPYAHIIEDNFKSFSLQQKLGAIVASGKVVWMSRSDEKRD